MTTYAKLDWRNPGVAGAQTASTSHRSAEAAPRQAVQSTHTDGLRVRSLQAISRALDERAEISLHGSRRASDQPASPVVQRVVKVGGKPIGKIATIRAYKAYKRLSLGDKSRVDQEYFALRANGNFDADSEDALIAHLAELNRPVKLPEGAVFRAPDADIPDEAPDTYRKASFDDTTPLTIYRVVSPRELSELRTTIRDEGSPIFKHREDREGGEKFFGTNKRYVWSQWAGKGKRGKKQPQLIKVVLRPGARKNFLHKPAYASLHSSAKDIYRPLKDLSEAHASEKKPKPVLIKREAKDKKLGLTSLNYGFRGRGKDNTGLEKLAEYITAIDIVGDDERAVLESEEMEEMEWDDLGDGI